MHEPTAEWLFSVQLLSLFFFFFFFHNSTPRHISLCGPRTAQTILSFSLSCLLCFLSPYEILRSDACQVAAAAFLNGSGGKRGWMEGRSGGRNQGGGLERGAGTWRRVEQRWRGRRPDASDADGLRRGGGGGVRVDPSKSLGSFSRLKLLPACEEQGLCLGVSHPGECLASG